MDALFKKPTVEFDHINLKDMSLFGATLLFYFNVNNPNPIGGTLDHLTYQLTIDEKSIASGNSEQGLHIASGVTESVELPVAINFFDVAESLAGLAEKDEIAYDLSGTFAVMGFTLPYHTNGKLPVPKLPEINLKEVNVSSLSWAGAALNFILELNNPNAFEMTMNSLEYNISMGGNSFLSGKSKKNLSISEKGQTTVEIPLKVNFLQLGKSAVNLLSGQSTGYELNGAMNFLVPGMGEKKFQFNKSGKTLIENK